MKLLVRSLKHWAYKRTKTRPILLEGDEILLQEQSLRKASATQLFHPDHVAQLRTIAATEKRCFEAVVHEDNACIDQLQALGLGEYIGTDQSEEPLTGQHCSSCGKECTTFGYLTKRL